MSNPESLAINDKVPIQKARSRFGRLLERRILRFIQNNNILRPGERVVVGVSGGPDSTLLLLTLAHLKKELNIDLSVSHYDHKLRSKNEACADFEYVANLAQTLNLRFTFGSGDVRSASVDGQLSLEEAGRQLRYSFLAEEASRLKSQVVTVGHTANDQAETVLLHIIRGSGLRGLAAMAPRTSWPLGDGPDLARPLLALSRNDIIRYCQEESLIPRLDPSNHLLEASRNRVRHELLPALLQFNPKVEDALCRLAEAASNDADYLDNAASLLWIKLANKNAGQVVFPVPALTNLEWAMTSRLLRRAVQHLAGPGSELGTVHLKAVWAALHKQSDGVSLPYGLTAIVDKDNLRIGAPTVPTKATPIIERDLILPGRTVIGRWMVEAKYIDIPTIDNLTAGPLEAYLDSEVIGPQLTVRSRRPGDRISPLGLGGEKKLQDLLVDAKLPAEQRDAVPLVCASWGIAWVVGYRIDQRAAVSPKTKQVVHIKFRDQGPT